MLFIKIFLKLIRYFGKVLPLIFTMINIYIKRAKFIKNKINNVNFDEFIFSKNNDKLTIKGF